MSLLKILGLVLIALIPAISLYILFADMNRAEAAWLNNTMQLGGPVAAFFIILYFLSQLLQKLEHQRHDRDNPQLKKLQELEGDWKIDSSSATSGKAAISSTKLSMANGRLSLSGGTFTMSGENAEATGVGDWTCELAVSDGERLAYIYRFTEHGDNPGVWQGIADVRRVQGNALVFKGTWQVFGHKHHSGQIKLERV